MHGVRGGIGKQLVYRQHKGKTIVSAYPDMSGRRLSEAQKKQNDNLRIANAEFRRIKLDEILRNEAQLRLNGYSRTTAPCVVEGRNAKEKTQALS